MATINEKLSYLKETKKAIKAAINQKGVPVDESDSFRSYAERIGLISGNNSGSCIFRAYLPRDFKGSTAIGSTLLVNPASYFNDAQEKFVANSPNTLSAIPCSDYIRIREGSGFYFLFEKKDDHSFVKRKDNNEERSFPLFLNKNTLFSVFFNSGFSKYSWDDTNKIVKSVDNSDTICIFNQAYGYGGLLSKPILKVGNEIASWRAFSSYEQQIGILDIENLRMRRLNSGSEGYGSSLIGINKKNNYLYFLLSNNKIYKKQDGNEAEILSDWIEVPENFLGVNLSIQFFDGSYVFCIDVNKNIRVLKCIELENGDLSWVEDITKTTQFQNAIGSMSQTVSSIVPQLDKSIYLQNENKFVAYQYDDVLDRFIQIEHPCEKLIKETDPLGSIKNGVVNKVDGVCCLVVMIDSRNFELRYAHLVQMELGNLQWVAYEMAKKNFIPQSLTLPSLGVTGTDEKGNNYVEVKSWIADDDLGNFLDNKSENSV